jgi:hypothetical protein
VPVPPSQLRRHGCRDRRPAGPNRDQEVRTEPHSSAAFGTGSRSKR